MILILLGAPGVGKGTQAQFIGKEFSIPQISTGNILRKEVKDKSELGKKAKTFMNSGGLVPDDVIVDMMEKRIKENDCVNGFILDGFPRTIAQADALGKMLEKNNLKLDSVILIDVAQDKIVKRLTGRRVCEKCAAVYHIENNPPKKDGICDLCGGSLMQRDDDKEEVVLNRLKTYEELTEPLIAYYSKKDNLKKIDGVGEIEDIFKRIKAVLE